ncbi:MAG: hypothetical protein QG646_3444 [Euryarchaeota archaeon]|nr:hypothetical protein [Euryarchaeota archaeon]
MRFLDNPALKMGFSKGMLKIELCLLLITSPYYLLGWIGFGLIPVAGAIGDLRDAVQSFLNGSPLDAALNLAGIFSGAGDGVKTVAAIKIFVLAHDASKTVDIIKLLLPYFGRLSPTVKIGILDALYKEAATKLIGEYGDEILEDLIVIAKNNGDLSKTLGIVKSSGGEVRWLEEGTTSTGWKHIFERHIKN